MTVFGLKESSWGDENVFIGFWLMVATHSKFTKYY